MTTHPYTRLFPKTIDPGVADDTTAGYERGDIWVTSVKSFQCLDPAEGAAVWIDLTASDGGGSIDGSGGEGQLAVWNDTNTLIGDPNFTWDPIASVLRLKATEDQEIFVITGVADGTSFGIVIRGGDGSADNIPGGDVRLTSGSATGEANAGVAGIEAGITDTGNGAKVYIYGGNVNVLGPGGPVEIIGGSTISGLGGSVLLQPGSGTDGNGTIKLTDPNTAASINIQVEVNSSVDIWFPSATGTLALVDDIVTYFPVLAAEFVRFSFHGDDPTVIADTTDDYRVGDIWLTPTKSWQCLDASEGAAVWVELTGSGGGGGFTQEEIEDFVGGMVTGNTETGIEVTYDDAGGKLNFDAQTAGDIRYAPIAKGVTNGDFHNHEGGDGSQVDHGGLSGLSDDDHSQYHNDTRGDARYLKLDASNDPVTEKLEIIPTTPATGGIFVNTSGDAATADFIQETDADNITAESAMTMSQASTGAGNISTPTIRLDKDEAGAGTVGGDWIQAHHGDDIAGHYRFRVDIDGNVIIPTGATYEVNGSPHTHALGTQEEIEDIVGAMVTGNTETGIAVTYDDAGGKLNFDAQTAGDARYAPIAKGVTNGDTHDHNGGDGAQINHTTLSNIGTNTHAQVDTHLASTANPHAVTAAQAGATPIDGWLPRSETWTRTGNHTFTVSGDLTTIFRTGVKLRYKDGGSYEYGVIASSSFASSTTTVNLIVNIDFTMAAATITDTYISLIANPESWPKAFNFTPTITYDGGSTNPTSNTVNVAKWRVNGTDIFFTINSTLVKGSGNRARTIYSIPVTPAAISIFPGMDTIGTGALIGAIVYAYTDGKMYYEKTMGSNGDYYINGSFSL